MITKEKIREQRTRLEEMAQGRTALMIATEMGIGLFLGAILSSAQVFGRCAPFGVAAVAAAGPGLAGLGTLIGAALGYLYFLGTGGGGLHYGAAAVLTFSLLVALHDFSITRRRWFAPATAALLCAITRFTSITMRGFLAVDVIFYCTEIFLVAGAVYCYREAVNAQLQSPGQLGTLTQSQRLGTMALGGSVLIALSGVLILGEYSLGRALAAMAVMVLARRGANMGLMSGVGMGLAMDLASGRGPYYIMAYAVAGALAGLGWRHRKIFTAIAYVAANGAVVLWTWESGMRLPLLYEVFAASVLFMLLPRRFSEVATQMLSVPRPKHAEWEKAKEVAAMRMKKTASAFRELYESIRDTFRAENASTEDVAVIFHRTAERQCRKCQAREVCWQRDFQTTQGALNDATGPMMERGRLLAEDFPGHFRNRCLYLPDFIAAANEELVAFLYRKQYQGRMRESRAALCRQYAELDRILGRAAVELSAELTPDLPREAKLRNFLRLRGLPEDGTAYYDEAGHLRVETPDSPELRSPEGREKLSRVLGVSLREPESREGRLRFIQAEPFRAVAGVAGRNKEGETVSGDTGTWFRREDGLLCILLCDGMGSGVKAREESALAVRLLQNFLKAGVEPEAALCTVNAALALKGEETGGCTTVDLLTVELYTGLCCVYKFGAAPTYLRQKGDVRRIGGVSPPAGLMTGEEVRPDITRFRGEAGDWIVLLTDGITGGEEDTWLREAMSAFDGVSPGVLAERVLTKSGEEQRGADDSTVIAVRLESRKA